MASNQDLLDIANQAEKDLNSYQAKQGLNNNSASGMLFFSPLLSSSLLWLVACLYL